MTRSRPASVGDGEEPVKHLPFLLAPRVRDIAAQHHQVGLLLEAPVKGRPGGATAKQATASSATSRRMPCHPNTGDRCEDAPLAERGALDQSSMAYPPRRA